MVTGVTSYRWGSYTTRFEYDAQGRLIAEVIDNPQERPRTNQFWAYDERGAVRRLTMQSIWGRGPPKEAFWEFQYDSGGRESAATLGPTRIETTYAGDCAKVVAAQPTPKVFEIMHLVPCFNSPGGVVRRCF